MTFQYKTSIWNDASKLDRLKELYALGWTDERIAADLGVSSNAITGKRHRIKLIGANNLRKVTKVWPDDAVKLLRKLWLDGVTVRDIARKFGKSEKAICQKSTNLGLPRRARFVPPKMPRVFLAKPVLVKTPIVIPAPNATPVKLMERTGCACPVGDVTGEHQLFCNAPIDQGSYCNHHKAILFNAAYHPKNVVMAGKWRVAR